MGSSLAVAILVVQLTHSGQAEPRFYATRRMMERQILPVSHPSWKVEAGQLPFALRADGKPAFTEAEAESSFNRFAAVKLHFEDGSRAPVPGMEVQLFPSVPSGRVEGIQVDRALAAIPDELKGVFESKTDADGDAVFPGLPEGQAFSVTVVDGEGDRQVQAVLKGSVEAGQAQSVTLDRRRTISGRVYLQESGKPFPGASVRLVGPAYHNWAGFATTDSAGRYRFSNLLPGRYNVMCFNPKAAIDLPLEGPRYQVEAREPDGRWVLPGGGCEANLTSNSADHADFRLVKSARVAITVIGKTGQPIPNGFVEIDNSNGSGEGHVADSHGVAVFYLAPSEYKVSAGTSMGGKLFGRKSLSVKEGQKISLTAPIPG